MRLQFQTIFFYCSLLLFFGSCSQEEIPLFHDVIPKQKLSLILIDMHIIDGTIQSSNNNTREKIRIEKEYYDSVIFQKHGVTDSLFRASIEYYAIYGGVKDIYSKVLDSLNTVNAQLEIARQKRINAQKQNTNTEHK